MWKNTLCKTLGKPKNKSSYNTLLRTIPCRVQYLVLLRHSLVVEKNSLLRNTVQSIFFHDILNNVIRMFFKFINIRWLKNTVNWLDHVGLNIKPAILKMLLFVKIARQIIEKAKKGPFDQLILREELQILR